MIALERVDQLELMDTVQLSPNDMKETLHFLAVTNKYFGGANLILKHLQRFSRNWQPGSLIKILDVGAGGGEIPMAVAEWGRKNNFKIRVTALDLVPEIIEIAKTNMREYPEIVALEKNFFDWDETSSGFDYVTASLLFHHIPPAEQIAFIQKADRLARRGIVISDLERSAGSYAAVWLLSRLIGNKIVRHDAPLSVKRSFTVDELTQTARAANVAYLNTSKEAWFRVSLAGEKC